MVNNKILFEFLSLSTNESLARNVAGLFALQLNPSLSEISDIKTAVSEAVTNCIVHGYQNAIGSIQMECSIENDVIHINVYDQGVGIADVDKALEPFFSTKEEEERSGMGFTIMKSFMDNVVVKSAPKQGTRVYMSKKIKVDV